MNTNKIKIMNCTICNRFLDERQNGLFYECPKCKWTFWPPEKDDTPEKLARAARKAMAEDTRIGNFGNGGKKGGGGKSKSRKKSVKSDFSYRYRHD